MRADIVERISKAGVRDSFDPSSLNDPIALQIDWTPVVWGGTNYCTYRLASVSSSRLEFHPSIEENLFRLIFSFFSKLSFLTSFFKYFLPVFESSPIVFDKNMGKFFKERKAFESPGDKDSLKQYVELDQIHALQIIYEQMMTRKESEYSYELNLVLKNGQRINVFDHGDINALREDAAMLSGFLNVPVWDAI